MKNITLGLTLLVLSTLPAFAGKLDLKQLNIEMDKSAARAAISIACGTTGKQMARDLVASLRTTYESIDSITPGGFDFENALKEVAAPLECKRTVLSEVQSGYLSVEEALAAVGAERPSFSHYRFR